MIVHRIELASQMWAKIRCNADVTYAPAQSAFFSIAVMPRNSASKHYLGYWNVRVRVRFNLAAFPRATMPTDLVGVNALTDGIEHADGEGELVLRRAVSTEVKADAYLVVVHSSVSGRINFRSDWKTSGVEVVSASSNRAGQQETLLLMPNESIIRTEDGPWGIKRRRVNQLPNLRFLSEWMVRSSRTARGRFSQR